ncbi:ABC transporter permease subunit [Actinophytocola oryzae]|uniref:ABC-2 type transport system permease protein n=1 Tax=Actinophytocola oryzae TaxID=502181 RepID=A0A4V3FSE1_9PSEU|nr:ABC transporter permease subunit [Actinophytocola oryzae]TDV47091.1 ABC-2 type transport system permease protein [Actinophytocola oryzae]
MTLALDAPIVTEQRTKAPLGRLMLSELRFMFRRPRTLVAFGLLVIGPILAGIAMAVATSVPDTNKPGTQVIEGVAALVANNGLILPVFVLLLCMVMLLPMLGAMWSADAIAGETSTGALRGLLLAPVSRVRLLAVKAFGVAVLTATAVLTITVVGILAGMAILGGDGLLTMSGNTLAFGQSLGRIGLMAVLVIVQVWAVAAVALAISAATEHPLVVMAAALGGIIVFTIVNNIPALDWLHPFLLTDGWNSLADVLRDPMPTDGIMEGLLRAVCYIVIGYSIALGRMSTKDG